MKIVIDISKDRYDEIMSMDWKNCRLIFDEEIRAIHDGKTLEQEPKTGQWEWVQYDSNPNIGNWHCSECRTIIPDMPEETDHTPIYKWCPMCGAKMSEIPTGAEGSDKE